jgi:hypothetical protein
LKHLTVTNLKRISDGDTKELQETVSELRDRLLLFQKPKVYTGHDGLEVRHDKEFETMCLLITKETGRDAKDMSVLEYYNAYEYLREQSHRTQNKARQGV